VTNQQYCINTDYIYKVLS